MRIVRKKEYLSAIKIILAFISKDSKIRAYNFKNQLDEKIDNLVDFPYKFRPSIHSNDNNVRDLIYKGYTIIYFIEVNEDRILILDIFKWMDK